MQQKNPKRHTTMDVQPFRFHKMKWIEIDFFLYFISGKRFLQQKIGVNHKTIKCGSKANTLKNSSVCWLFEFIYLKCKCVCTKVSTRRLFTRKLNKSIIIKQLTFCVQLKMFVANCSRFICFKKCVPAQNYVYV